MDKDHGRRGGLYVEGGGMGRGWKSNGGEMGIIVVEQHQKMKTKRKRKKKKKESYL